MEVMGDTGDREHRVDQVDTKRLESTPGCEIQRTVDSECRPSVALNRRQPATFESPQPQWPLPPTDTNHATLELPAGPVECVPGHG